METTTKAMRQQVSGQGARWKDSEWSNKAQMKSMKKKKGKSTNFLKKNFLKTKLRL